MRVVNVVVETEPDSYGAFFVNDGTGSMQARLPRPVSKPLRPLAP